MSVWKKIKSQKVIQTVLIDWNVSQENPQSTGPSAAADGPSVSGRNYLKIQIRNINNHKNPNCDFIFLIHAKYKHEKYSELKTQITTWSTRGTFHLIFCKKSGELALLQDDHVLLYRDYFRHHLLQHDFLSIQTTSCQLGK